MHSQKINKLCTTTLCSSESFTFFIVMKYFFMTSIVTRNKQGRCLFSLAGFLLTILIYTVNTVLVWLILMAFYFIQEFMQIPLIIQCVKSQCEILSGKQRSLGIMAARLWQDVETCGFSLRLWGPIPSSVIDLHLSGPEEKQRRADKEGHANNMRVGPAFAPQMCVGVGSCGQQTPIRQLNISTLVRLK